MYKVPLQPMMLWSCQSITHFLRDKVVDFVVMDGGMESCLALGAAHQRGTHYPIF